MIKMLNQSTRLPGLTKTKGIMLASLIAAAAFAYPAMAGDEVPYNGTEVGVITSVSFHFPFDMKSQTAEGEATQFGHYSLTGSFVVDVRSGTGAGAFTLTAANGDMLFLDMETAVVPTDLTKTVAHFTVTGGTGRFEGATGSFTSSNQLAHFVGASSNPYVAEIEGTISTPGANKK
jgi:hypothetical protein